MRGISWLAANQLASHEGLCTMEWVSKTMLNASNRRDLWRCFYEPSPEVLLAEVNSPRSFSLTWQQSLPHPCSRKPPSQLQDLKTHEDPPPFHRTLPFATATEVDRLHSQGKSGTSDSVQTRIPRFYSWFLVTTTSPVLETWPDDWFCLQKFRGFPQDLHVNAFILNEE